MFATNLKILRNDENLSLKQLADRLNVSDVTVLRWESGQAEPKLSYLIRIADLYEMSIDELVGRANYEGVVKINNDITPQDKSLLEAFHKLNRENQIRCLGYMDGLFRSQK